ncbi:hypothetical protein F5Y18DRAFT_407686 [Xylariaceae sp. FL1019]|nr:hypothetical protein F5Y18DRAFT_407686 [Xylariaceae sp. FL1019]
MRFFTTAALFGALAVATPCRRDMTEDVQITEFYVHQALVNGTTRGVVDGVSFVLNGENATDLDCSAQTGLPSEVISCGDSPYSFALYPGESSYDYTLRLYHALGVAVGFYGSGLVPVYCRAGGGPTLVCAQVENVTITIDSF